MPMVVVVVVVVDGRVVDGGGSVVEVVVVAGAASRGGTGESSEQAPVIRARAKNNAGRAGNRMPGRLRHGRAKAGRPCIIRG